MLNDKDLVEVAFPLGKDNVAPETDLPEGAARELLNVDLFNDGSPARRKGYISVYSGTAIHSLYSTDWYTIFCEGGSLKHLTPLYTASVLTTGLDPSIDLSYAQVNNQVYYSNGKQSGVITEDVQHAQWGVDAPDGQPTLAYHSAYGSMEGGTYQVAITFVSALGEESGARRAAVVDVSEGGGISLTDIPQGDASNINIYLTQANSEVLYLHSTVAMGTTDVVITNSLGGRALETQFLERMPAGHIVRYYKGRMWVAVDNIIIFSPGLRYGLYDPRFTYYQFSERVTMMQPVDDGIYVASDKTYFLSGENPEKMEQELVDTRKAIEYTGISVPPQMLDMDNKMVSSVFSEKTFDYVAFWYSTAGAMLGFPGGRVKPIMENRLNISEYGRGATLMREENGLRQLVTSLTNKGDGSAFGATDVAVAEVRRNGIVI